MSRRGGRQPGQRPVCSVCGGLGHTIARHMFIPHRCSACGQAGHQRRTCPRGAYQHETDAEFWAACWREITPRVRVLHSITDGRLLERVG